VVCVGDQADYNVDFGDLGVESLRVVDIELVLSVLVNHEGWSMEPTLMAVALGIPLASACALSSVLQAEKIVSYVCSEAANDSSYQQ
jgi:hypothetical protein